jgi:hypothetical protein
MLDIGDEHRIYHITEGTFTKLKACKAANTNREIDQMALGVWEVRVGLRGGIPCAFHRLPPGVAIYFRIAFNAIQRRHRTMLTIARGSLPVPLHAVTVSRQRGNLLQLL